MLSPQGDRLEQSRVAELALEPRLILLCGRYEGFDERIIEILEPELLSVGDFILSGGEVAAMVLIDAIVRLIPGRPGRFPERRRRVVRPGWRTRISPVHPPTRLPRQNRPRDSLERRPRRHRPLAARTPPVTPNDDLERKLPCRTDSWSWSRRPR